jgi:hypothetical protein
MSRFAEARKGRGPRYPKAGKAVLGCLVGVGIAYSQLLYPEVRPVEKPIRRIAESVDQRIEVKVTLKAGMEGPDRERTVRLLRRMREIGRRVLREERGQ